MTTYYLYSGASGTLDLGTESDPFLTYASMRATVIADDLILMDYRHNEVFVDTTTILDSPSSGGIGIYIVSVDFDDTYAYRKSISANFEVTGTAADLTIDDSICFYGVYFKCGDRFTIASPDTNEFAYFYQITIESTDLVQTSTIAKHSPQYIECDFKTSPISYMSGDYLACTMQGGNSGIGGDNTYLIGGKYSTTTSVPFITTGINVCGLDLTSIASGSDLVSSTTKTTNVKIAGSDVGVGINQVHRFEVPQGFGDGSRITLDEYRDNGAVLPDDTPYAIELYRSTTSYANVIGGEVFGPWITEWVTGDGSTSKTFTVHMAHDGTVTAPTNLTLYLEIAYYGETNTTEYKIASTDRKFPNAFAFSKPYYPSSTESWTGLDTTNAKHKLVINLDGVDFPKIVRDGYLMWRVVSRSYHSIYYCPKLEIT